MPGRRKVRVPWGAFCMPSVWVWCAAPPACRPLMTAAVVIEGMETSIVVLTSSTRPDYLEGKLIGSVIARLRAASPTFRDVLAALAASPRLLTLISTSTDVKGRPRDDWADPFPGGAGPRRGICRHLRGPRQPAGSERAPSPMSWGTSQKWRVWESSRTRKTCVDSIRGRANWVGTSDKGEPLETGFAVRIGEQVLQEASSKRRLTSQFTRLTAQSA